MKSLFLALLLSWNPSVKDCHHEGSLPDHYFYPGTLLQRTAIMKGLFLALLLSWNLSAEKNCTDTLCLLGIALSPFALGKQYSPGWIYLL